MKKERTQSTTGHRQEGRQETPETPYQQGIEDRDQSTTNQRQTDTQSTGQTSPDRSSKATHPTFRDALESLGTLSAQCGSAGIRKRHKDTIYKYLCWAALWLCEYGVEDDFPTKVEAKRLLEGLRDDLGE